jgi:transcriptional regulator with XRE-family HTH domain
VTEVQRPRFYLAEWIEARGYTLDQTAELSHLSKTHVTQLKSGKRRWNEGVLLKLASGLGLTSPLDLFRDPEGYESAEQILARIPPAMRPVAVRTLQSFAEPQGEAFKADPGLPRPRRRRRS